MTDHEVIPWTSPGGFDAGTSASVPGASFHPEFMFCMECSSCTNADDVLLETTTDESSDSAAMTRNGRISVDATCRSVLHVNGICCPSEVPTIHAILQQINTLKDGLTPHPISKISINITSRLVYVEHDASHVTAQDMARILNKEGFGASVQSDGSVSYTHDGDPCSSQQQEDEQATSPRNALDDPHSIGTKPWKKSRFVESTLVVPQFLSNTWNARDIHRLLKIKNYIPDQIRALYLHPVSNTIKIEHDPNQISASTIAEILSASTWNGDMVLSTTATIQVHIDGGLEGLTLPDTAETEPLDSVKDSHHWMEKIVSITPGLHWNIVLSGIFWILSMIGELFDNLDYLKLTGLLSVLFGLPPVALKAYRTLRRGHFDANCMMVFAALGATMLGEYEEAASVSFLFAISEFLETRAASQAKEALDSIVHLRPDHANLITDLKNTNKVAIVPTSCLPIGSVVSVRMGDKIPADGIVLEGQSYLDESSLTGEPTPILRSPGDFVHGGSINVGFTRLLVRTTKKSNDSAVSRLIRLVEEAQVNRSRTETMVDRFARVYTPIVIVVALSMCTIPWLVDREMGRKWMMNGLIIIVIACPCALTISTPVTYAAGLTAAARRGIIVKGGCHLESLGNVKTVVLDKTGTITWGKFRLVELVITCDTFKRREALELLAVMESHSSHPLSATLVNAAHAEGVSIPKDLDVKDHTTIPGEGLTAVVDKKSIYLGNARLLERIGHYQDLPDKHKMLSVEWGKAGCTVGYLSVEGMGIVAMFCVSDILREEAADVVETLEVMGVRVMMVTGDGEGTARAVAEEVGIDMDHVHSKCSPEDKMYHIGRLQGSPLDFEIAHCYQKKLVAMVGDGVNDVGALKRADVGIAMGEGACSLAMEMSDITFMDSNLRKLPFSLELGRTVVTIIRENIAISVVSKLVIGVLTFYNSMTLLLAIASDIGIMLFVTLNGMRPLRKSSNVSKTKQRWVNKHVAYNQLEVVDQE